MSRFYEALKLAGKTRPSSPDNAGGPEWEAWTIDGAEPPAEETKGNNGSAGAELADPLLAQISAGIPRPQLGAVPLPAELSGSPAAAPPAAHGSSPGETDPAAANEDPWVIGAALKQKSRSAEAPFRVSVDSKARLIPNASDPTVVEYYRRLRTKLVQQHAVKPFRSLLVTSPAPEDGKTLTVLNLALSFAMLPAFRVLVIDGDLRRGTLRKQLGVENRPGLSNLIEGSGTLDDVVLKAEELPFHLMTSGNSKTPAGELLQSSELKTHLKRLTERFSLVLIDSPPVNLITDAQLLAGNCDAVVLVARAFSTTAKALEKSARDLQQCRILGTVLNGGARSQLYRGYGYGWQY